MPRWRRPHQQDAEQPPDPRAFEAAVEEFWEPLYRFCLLRLGGNVHAAEDAVQEIMIDAWRGYGRFTPWSETSLGAWLFTIARRRLVDVYTRSSRVEFSLDVAVDISDPEAMPEHIVLAHMDVSVLHELIGSLSGYQREVIELRAADLHTKEIAQILNLTEVNVRQIQSRAISAMRIQLKHRTGGVS